MERVRIIKDLYIAQGDVRYKSGEEVEVADAVAKRHVKTGHMKIVAPDKPAKSAKPDKK